MTLVSTIFHRIVDIFCSFYAVPNLSAEYHYTLNKIISLFILDEIKFSEFSESFTKIYIDQIDDSLLDEIPITFIPNIY